MTKYLISNPGSASKKYAFYANLQCQLEAHFEKEGSDYIVNYIDASGKNFQIIGEAGYQEAFSIMVDELLARHIIAKKEELTAIGLRVAAPGSHFLVDRLVDAEYRQKLNAIREVAPLHVDLALAEIEYITKILPKVTLVGVSDSAFHRTLPQHSRYYALNFDTAKELEIIRYGYHGISCQSVLAKLNSYIGQVPAKIIICHLGSGASITAIANGKSVDTSMGFTPLEGVPMGTRVGDIDAGAVIYLGKKLGLDGASLEKYLSLESGLLGMSGTSSDVKNLLEKEKTGDGRAWLAVDIFAYRIKKYIGAYMAALGGLDWLIFSGTIGERSAEMRTKICQELNALGINLDEPKNHGNDIDRIISAADSRVKIGVVKSDELSQMVKNVRAVIQN